MPWDDDVEQLTRLVRKTLGDNAFQDALSRALHAATSGMPEAYGPPMDPADLKQGWLITSTGERFSLDTLYDALRDELRRLQEPP